MLNYIASIYEPLGCVKIPWDDKIPDIEDVSSNKIVLPWVITLQLRSVTAIDVHVFGDANILVNFEEV